MKLSSALEEKLKGTYSPSPGIVYPTLTLLEELGYVTITSREDGKKIHSITAEGIAYLVGNKEALDATFQRIAQTLNDQPAPQLVRAMENLKFALRLRLASGPLAAADIEHIASVLDNAARQVEKKA